MTQPPEEILPPEGAKTDKPQTEPMTTAQAKAACCTRLKNVFSNKLMEERLLKMAGGDASRVAKNLTAFLSLIMEHDGGNRDPKKKKYYHQCSVQSLTACFLESMNMQLPFDSRKLVSIIIYNWEATLDISYKGFVNALNRHFKDAFVECKLVFEDDKFSAEIDGRTATYKFKPADPFAVVTKDFKGIKGGYCFFSYTDTDGKYTSRLVFLSQSQILKNKSRAEQTYVWDSDPKAMAEKTCIREGARLPFAAIDLDVDIEEVDNRHYRLEKPEGSDKLKLLIEAQEEAVHGKPDNNEKSAGKDEGKKPEKENTTMDNANASNRDDGAVSASANDYKQSTGGDKSSVSNSRSGANSGSGGSDGRSLEENKTNDKIPLLVTEEMKRQDISDADFDDEAAAYAGMEE